MSVTGRALLRGAGREEERGNGHEGGGDTNHFRRWLRSSDRCITQRLNYLPLTAGGGGGGGAFCWQALRRAEAATRVRIAIFMCCVWVLTVLLWFPSTRLLAAGLSRLTTSSVFANKQITLHLGNAREIIPGLPFKWDLVFIDADKTSYIDYYEMVLPVLSERGFIIADNVLFHGQVLEDPLKGKNAKAIHAFNEHVQNDPRTEQVMLSIRDGISIIKKRKA